MNTIEWGDARLLTSFCTPSCALWSTHSELPALGRPALTTLVVLLGPELLLVVLLTCFNWPSWLLSIYWYIICLFHYNKFHEAGVVSATARPQAPDSTWLCTIQYLLTKQVNYEFPIILSCFLLILFWQYRYKKHKNSEHPGYLWLQLQPCLPSFMRTCSVGSVYISCVWLWISSHLFPPLPPILKFHYEVLKCT